MKQIKGLSCLKSKRWWNAAGTRAIKTAAQSALGALVVETIWDIDWTAFLGVILVPTLASLLTSLGGIPEVEENQE
jgi:hypothetical protein